MTAARTALVIGGGVAGPAVAMALRKAGIDATVYEAYERTADNVGAFLTVESNGIDALRTIDADKGLLDTGFRTPTITLRSTTGKYLGRTKTGEPLSDGTNSHTLRRSDLYRVLQYEAISRGIAVERGKRFVDAVETEHDVRAIFEDGTEVTADVLIGADGIDSTVRTLIDPSAPAPKYTGLINFGNYTTGVPVDTESCTYSMIFGKRAFFGYGVRPDWQVWWYASLPYPAEPVAGELAQTSAEQWRRTLIDYFTDDAGPAVRLIESTDEPDALIPTPTRSVPRLPSWHSDRMVLTGDAAHAPTPTSGQGASLSIEDGVLLAKCLRDVAEPQQAFATFEALRRPRVESIIKAAERINSNKAPGLVGRTIRDLLMPVLTPLFANAKRSVHRYHIEWDQPVQAVG